MLDLLVEEVWNVLLAVRVQVLVLVVVLVEDVAHGSSFLLDLD